MGFWDLGGLLSLFRELGSTGNNFRTAREQAHNLGDLGSLVKKQKKSPYRLIFLKIFILLLGG